MNSIELITKYSTKAWDKVYKAEALSSLLDAPEAQVQFTGAKTVKIAKFSASGLGNYYRGADENTNGVPIGYARGNIGLTWEEFTLRQDRSAAYPVELFDNEETDGLALGAATTDISRTIIIPEVDAYCFSEIANHASDELGNLVDGVIGAADNQTKPLTALNAGLLYFDEHEVPAEKQIIFASPKYMNALRNNDGGELNRYLMQSDYSKDVKFTLTSYEGRKFAVVPPQRFKTNIKLGESGYTYDDGESKEIDFMIVATDAILHVVKYNKVKVIGGDMNLAGQGFDGYTIFARVYHDVFVPDNKRFGIYVHTGGFSTMVEPKLDVITRDGKVERIVQFPGEVLTSVYATKRSDKLSAGDTFTYNASDDKLIKVGTAIDSTYTDVVAVKRDKTVLVVGTPREI